MESKNIRFKVMLVVLLSVVIAVLILFQPESEQDISPTIIRIGVLPDENVEALKKRFQPLLAYLASDTNLKFELIIPSDYTHLLQLFGQNKVDLAYFGGFTFLKAQKDFNAEALIMRDVDTRFTSWFLIKGDRDEKDIMTFKDKSFTFGSKLSTSGHLMPRYFLHNKYGIEPSEFFSKVTYSGTHDKTAYLVRDGEVDIGVANTEVIKKMLEDGRLSEKDIQVIWETPPFPDYVWSVQSSLNKSTKIKIRNAFLTLDNSDHKQREILHSMGAEIFLPASAKNFEALKNIANKLDLLN